jgi:hypothetical protein
MHAMAAEWHRYCRADGFDISGNTVTVELERRRTHRVAVTETTESYEFAAVALGATAFRTLGPPVYELWQRNRRTRLVGFRLDDRRRLLVDAWLPKHGVTPPEFRLVLRTVAAEADRAEFLLTGQDRL